MIESAVIKNYKGFRELSLSELSRITLLGGSNNTGKTSAIEALFLFFDRINPNVFFRQFAWRGVSTVSPTPEVVWAPMFHNYQMDEQITISVKQGIHNESMEIKFNPSQSRRVIEIQQTNTEKTSLFRTDQQPLLSYSLEIVYNYDAKKPQKASLIIRYRPDGINVSLEPETQIDIKEGAIFLAARARFDANEDANRYGALDVLGKQEIIFDVLRIIEPRLLSLSSVAVGLTSSIHGDIGIGRKIPVALMGDGIDRLLSIVLAIATCKDGVVFIDEIENGMHHSVMAKIWEGISKAAQQFNCQIIATTHSYECLQAAHEGLTNAKLADAFKYIRLDRVGEDIATVVYTHDVLGAALERGWEVR